MPASSFIQCLKNLNFSTLLMIPTVQRLSFSSLFHGILCFVYIMSSVIQCLVIQLRATDIASVIGVVFSTRLLQCL